MATTHSPYMVDLFKDHPEQIVLADKIGEHSVFKKLSSIPNIEEILGDAPLGEAWYSGIFGGVPASSSKSPTLANLLRTKPLFIFWLELF